MINPLLIKNFIESLIKSREYQFPYLDSSMSVEESLITSGSILLIYDGSDFSYSNNVSSLPSKTISKARFKVSIVYQSLVQDDQSLVIYNQLVPLIVDKFIESTDMKPLRIVSDKLKQYEGSKKLYGVFEHEIIFETEYRFSQLNQL